METHDDDELGPIDILVIGYPAGAPMTGEAMPIFLDLVNRGVIRVLDALFVLKAEDGTVSDAGATLFVAGSSIFGAAEPAAAYREIATAIDAV